MGMIDTEKYALSQLRSSFHNQQHIIRTPVSEGFLSDYNVSGLQRAIEERVQESLQLERPVQVPLDTQFMAGLWDTANTHLGLPFYHMAPSRMVDFMNREFIRKESLARKVDLLEEFRFRRQMLNDNAVFIHELDHPPISEKNTASISTLDYHLSHPNGDFDDAYMDYVYGRQSTSGS